jgi:hypothetical protein
MIINKKNFIDYTFMFLLIAVSGIPYFSTTILYIPLFVVYIISFFIRGYKFDREFMFFLLFLTIITIAQTLVFEVFSFQNSLGVYFRIVLAYLVVKLLNKKFIEYYVNIFYYLAIFAVVIYAILVIVPSSISLLKSIVPIFNILNITGSNQETIIIYNFNALKELRNSGPFWEPGAFGGYLIIAIIFTFFKSDIANRNKKLLVFIIALLTTLSTTAFSALAVFLFFYYYKSIRNVFLKMFVITSILGGMYYAFFNLDFLGHKILSQIQIAKNADVYGKDTNTQRFMNILRDIKDFKGHEIVGRGFNPYTRYAYNPEEQIRTVGLTDILVKMGIPFFVYMVLLLYKSLCVVIENISDKQGSIYCIGSFLTVFVTLMSEVYFNFPMYWSLLFLFLVYKSHKESKKI